MSNQESTLVKNIVKTQLQQSSAFSGDRGVSDLEQKMSGPTTQQTPGIHAARGSVSRYAASPTLSQTAFRRLVYGVSDKLEQELKSRGFGTGILGGCENYVAEMLSNMIEDMVLTTATQRDGTRPTVTLDNT